jgi:hypothetical protein
MTKLRMSWAVVLCAVLAGAAVLGGCKVNDPPPIESKWTDDFGRAELGDDYRPTVDSYQLVNGTLGTRGAFNHPLWLRKKLPADAVIELDCWSTTPDGDIKVELWGDGTSHARDKGAYTSSGYVVIMGGWNNSKSMIARGNEHGKDLVERAQPKVLPGQRYHWKITRRGGRIEWYVDNMTEPFLALDDPAPLSGAGHEFFGFNNWQSDSWFDNLAIAPL